MIHWEDAPEKSTNMNHQLNQPLVEEYPCIYIRIYTRIYIYSGCGPLPVTVANEGL